MAPLEKWVIDAERRLMRNILRNRDFSNRLGELPEIEHALIRALSPMVPTKTAVDIGGNRGAYTDLFLSLDYAVSVIEPAPTLVKALRERYCGRSEVAIIQAAVSDNDGRAELSLAEVTSEVRGAGDEHLFNTLTPYGAAGLVDFPSTIPAVTRTLRTLRADGLVPPDIGFLKIDTEGHDRAVLAGALPDLGHVTLCEFWSDEYVLGSPDVPNEPKDYAELLRDVPGLHFLTLGRTAENRFYVQVGAGRAPAGAWGNVMFTADHTLFMVAANWCLDVLGRDALIV